MRAITKDILRTLRHEKKRFISLAVISALGVVMLTGLKSACNDLRLSADSFFDTQNLYDITILSTLGLTDEDVEALYEISGVEAVEGTYSEKVYTTFDGKRNTSTMKIISENGMNMPYVLEGKLPQSINEIAVTSNYLSQTGKKIGDTLVIEEIFETTNDIKEETTNIIKDDVASTGKSENEKEADFDDENDESPNFPITEYIITAKVVDPEDINAAEGVASFRSATTTDYTFFVCKDAVDFDVYSALYIRINEARNVDCYSDEYEAVTKKITDIIEENIKKERENARTLEVKAKAREELSTARTEAYEKLDDAKAELEDGQKEIDDGYVKLEEGLEELNKNEKEMKDAFIDAELELGAAFREVKAGQKELSKAIEDFEAQRAMMPASMAEETSITLEAKKAELTEARRVLNRNLDKLNASEEKAKKEIENARLEIEENRLLLEDAKAELEDGLKEYNEKKAEAEEELQKAEEEIEDIDDAVWYVEDRTRLSGYANVKSDTDSIEAIGNVFPGIFLLVAVLVSLTTATRMVEEDRGLLGTYKALGFSEISIRKKYTIFAVGASLIGGLVGDFGGFIVLPKIIFSIFTNLYQLPFFEMSFDVFYGVGGIALFSLCIYIATCFSCYTQLRETPAALMRPAAPKAGKPIILERIPFVWRRLSFLNKVTARNLFRYKKRLFMTVGGIMGCTALLLCGYAIKDSVAELLPGQYEKIYSYDVLVVSTDTDKFFEELNNKDQIEKWDKIYTSNLKVTGPNQKTESVQVMVFPDDVDENIYYSLIDADTGEQISLGDSGIAVSKNLSIMLGFKENDILDIQDIELNKSQIKVDNIVINYLGNIIYVKQSVYEKCFGKIEENGALIRVNDKCLSQIELEDELASIDGVISTVSTESLEKDFDDAFALINMVVYIIIILAASLAFVVLFTLSTTNISERERELSTIKVLGFHDREVHLYVNKETLILTLLGTILGIPVGTFLGHALTNALDIPAIYFAVTIYPVSYVISASLAVLFAILVSMLTGAFMDKINPVEALKSVE